MFDAYVVACSSRWDMLRLNLPSWHALSPKATLVIAAWEPEEAQWAPWPGSKDIMGMDAPFSLGRGRNQGLALCHADWLVAVLDADMMLPAAMPATLPAEGQALFPLYHRQQQNPALPPMPGRGWGNVIGRAGTLRKATWPNQIKWGGEDTAYANKLRCAGVSLIRTPWPGLMHRYHAKVGDWYKKEESPK